MQKWLQSYDFFRNNAAEKNRKSRCATIIAPKQVRGKERCKCDILGYEVSIPGGSVVVSMSPMQGLRIG